MYQVPGIFGQVECGGWIFMYIQSGAPVYDSVQFVNKTPITMVYDTQITIFFMRYIIYVYYLAEI